MKIQIEIDKDSIVQSSVDYLKRAISFSYRWITHEGEGLGYILASLHFMMFTCLTLMVIISHTVYPNFWLQLAVFCCILAVGVQHVVFKVCISTLAEEELTKTRSPFYNLVEDIFQISTNDFINYYLVAEITALGCFGLELISRVSMYLGGWSSKL